MLQLTPQMRILIATRPADFRNGIDGLVQLCRAVLQEEPMSGAVFVFRNRQRTALKLLVYDGRGYWLCHRRLSSGKFSWWPQVTSASSVPLEAHQMSVLLCGGNPEAAVGVPVWRPVASALPSRG